MEGENWYRIISFDTDLFLSTSVNTKRRPFCVRFRDQWVQRSVLGLEISDVLTSTREADLRQDSCPQCSPHHQKTLLLPFDSTALSL